MDYKPNLNLGYASVDASVIGKLADSGYQVTNTGKTVDSLSFTTGVSKQLLPGASVPGYVDGAGNFLVVDDNGRLNDVRRRPTGPTDIGGGFTDGPSVGPTDGFIPGGGGTGIIPPTLPPTLPPSPPPAGGAPPTPLPP